MPNRIIRDAILSSEQVCSLSWPEEVFYRRLMSIVDDYGRFEGNPQLIRSRCYPLQVDNVRVADITRWMAACQKAGLVVLYEVAGKQYVQIEKFGQQQRTPSKYPAPDISCAQMKSNDDLDEGVSEDEDVSTPGKRAAVLADRFARFWAAYPRKAKKGDAEKAFAKHKPSEDLLTQMLHALSWQTKTEQWRKEGGQFIPYPASWLNSKSWEDEPPAADNSHPVVHSPVIASNWWETPSGIEAKGKELGVNPDHFGGFYPFKLAVLEKAGPGPWRPQ